MTFKIKGHGDGSYETPVTDAKPLIEAPPIIYHPPYTAFTGEGKPAAAIGKPWAEVGRDNCTATGFAWYHARLDGNAPTLVAVRLYDPRTAAYGSYQAWMHPPTWEGGHPGSVVRLAKLRVRFTHIESTTAT